MGIMLTLVWVVLGLASINNPEVRGGFILYTAVGGLAALHVCLTKPDAKTGRVKGEANVQI